MTSYRSNFFTMHQAFALILLILATTLAAAEVKSTTQLELDAKMSVINQFEGSIATFDEGRFSKRPMRNRVGIATDAVSY